MKEPKKTTEAQKRAKQKYMERFVEIKVRMTPERRLEVQTHAKAQNESATTFINRAISETMERDQVEKCFEEAAADDSTETVTLEEYKEQSKTDTHG